MRALTRALVHAHAVRSRCAGTVQTQRRGRGRKRVRMHLQSKWGLTQSERLRQKEPRSSSQQEQEIT
eukprot:4170172-Pleurochrysis_carterae.AAC.1